jgi:hypothetical protein
MAEQMTEGPFNPLGVHPNVIESSASAVAIENPEQNPQDMLGTFYQDAPAMPFSQKIQTEQGKITEIFPIVDRMEEIFKVLSIEAGDEEAQKRMLSTAEDVIDLKTLDPHYKAPWETRIRQKLLQNFKKQEGAQQNQMTIKEPESRGKTLEKPWRMREQRKFLNELEKRGIIHQTKEDLANRIRDIVADLKSASLS